MFARNQVSRMRKSLHKDCGSQFKDSGQSDSAVLKVVWASIPY